MKWWHRHETSNRDLEKGKVAIFQGEGCLVCGFFHKLCIQKLYYSWIYCKQGISSSPKQITLRYVTTLQVSRHLPINLQTLKECYTSNCKIKLPHTLKSKHPLFNNNTIQSYIVTYFMLYIKTIKQSSVHLVMYNYLVVCCLTLIYVKQS